MTFLAAKNVLTTATDCQGTLNADINDSVTTIVLTAGHGARFPTTNFPIAIETSGVREIILIDSRSTDTLTVNVSGRGYDSSVAAAHSAGDKVYHWQIAKHITELQDAIPTDATIVTTDVTTNDASTSKHGWLTKLTAPASGLINYVGIAFGETVATMKALFDATSPSTQAFGDSAAGGTASTASRRDHKHEMMALPAIDACAAATDITTRNTSVSAHGLMPKLDDVASHFVNGDGAWTWVPTFGAVQESGLDFFHWTDTLTGSGSQTSKGYGTLTLDTGATAGSTAMSTGYYFGWQDWSYVRLTWQFFIYQDSSSANARRYFKMDTNATGDPTGSSIGFRVDGDAIKGIVHNGSTLTVVDLASSYAVVATYKMTFDGTTVRWFCDGVEKGNSTAVPSGLRAATHYLVASVENKADASQNLIRLANHFWKYTTD